MAVQPAGITQLRWTFGQSECSRVEPDLQAQRETAQNGFTITKITMAIISTVGTSFTMRKKRAE